MNENKFEPSSKEKARELENKAWKYIRNRLYYEEIGGDDLIKKKTIKSKKLYEMSFELDPTNRPIAWERYSQVLLDLKEFDLAEIWIDKYLKLGRGTRCQGEILYNKAFLCLLRNRFRESIEYLKKSFQVNLSFLELAFNDPRFKDLHSLKDFQDIIQPLKVFKVNDHITLKLFGKKTAIYVCNELFSICKRLVLNIPKKEINSYNDFDSIDEIIEHYETITTSPKSFPNQITSEEEFWGHCSNIQAWVEHNYDTKVLQSTRLSFPILKKLVDNDVRGALPILKEEIIMRLKSMSGDILLFFLEEGYMRLLSGEELFYSLLNHSEAEAMEDISKIMPCRYTILLDIEESLEYTEFRSEGKLHFVVRNGFVNQLEIKLYEFNQQVIDMLYRFSRLSALYIYYFYKPEDMGDKLQALGFEVQEYTDNYIHLVQYS